MIYPAYVKKAAGISARHHMLVPRLMHPAEVHNRETKTWKLVAHLRDIGITADDAAHMSTAAWRAAAGAAGVNEPSDLTCRLVVSMLSGSRSPVVVDPAEQR